MRVPVPASCEVIATDEFVVWWQGLPEQQHDAIRTAVGLIEDFGVKLGFPYSSGVTGSAYPSMRELRRKNGKHQLRVFYIFDETREAVLLLGGDKLGIGNKKFYETFTPLADKIWAQYLREQGRGGKKK